MGKRNLRNKYRARKAKNQLNAEEPEEYPQDPIMGIDEAYIIMQKVIYYKLK